MRRAGHVRTLIAALIASTSLLSACGHDHDSGITPANAADAPLASDPACQSLVPASQGGPLPQGDTAVLRWLGTANYELAYHGVVVIMDTYYERPARTAPLGFTVSQVQKANVILIGHAHSDHISDVAAVAAQTKAQVIGSAITTKEAQVLGVPVAQTTTVTGNNTEKFTYGDISITPTHIIHSTIEAGLTTQLAALYALDAPPLTAAEQQQHDAVSARGSSDPNIVTQGTMGFTFTFPNGFKIVWFDSVSNPSPEELQLATSVAPGVDVGIFPWTPHPIAETQLSFTFQHLQLFKPKLFLPDHHDAIWGLWLDNGLAPLFTKIRDELPGTKYAEPLYRSPICIRTSGNNRDEFYMGGT
ncbi:MBL fold metallo-hydrolase [Caballeronia sp. Sq4a]|uniref:MBL fold metallo-hydrolase n=1 Tax=Caballeronia sp. Sq4a TaxID=2878152 RepID=UPI0020C07040|nr:MBL fold metallo-hydrolase [Caballeronia sp. Sq4a]